MYFKTQAYPHASREAFLEKTNGHGLKLVIEVKLQGNEACLVRKTYVDLAYSAHLHGLVAQLGRAIGS